MSVKIGHASISENGSANGKRGDQTGREVRLDNWYSGGWLFMLRPINREIAEASASFMEKMCRNDAIGYGQNDRNTTRSEVLKVGFENVDKVKTPVNTDCSAAVALCAEAAGVNITYYKQSNGTMNAQTTHTMKRDFPATGKYVLHEELMYRNTDKHLLRGDILVSGGHTVMILSDGELAEQEEDMAVRYKTIEDIPECYKEETKKLIARGALKGKGANLGFDVTEDMLRTLIIAQRMIDEKR